MKVGRVEDFSNGGLNNVLHKIPPLILISMVNICGKSVEKSKKQITEIHCENKFQIFNETHNLINSFVFDSNGGYKDVDKWDPQFEKGNQIFICRYTTIVPNEDFCIVMISFLKDFHKNFLKTANKTSISLKDYVRMYLPTEKDILMRNSQRKLFHFAARNYLDVKHIVDKKSVGLGNEIEFDECLLPSICVLDCFEYLNDMIIIGDRIKLFRDCSIHNKDTKYHFKIYTDDKIHVLANPKKIMNKEDETCVDTYVYGKNTCVNTYVYGKNTCVDTYVYENILEKIDTNPRNNLMYKKFIVSNPHVLFSMNTNALNLRTKLSLKNVFKDNFVLDRIKLYR